MSRLKLPARYGWAPKGRYPCGCIDEKEHVDRHQACDTHQCSVPYEMCSIICVHEAVHAEIASWSDPPKFGFLQPVLLLKEDDWHKDTVAYIVQFEYRQEGILYDIAGNVEEGILYDTAGNVDLNQPIDEIFEKDINPFQVIAQETI